MTENGNTANLLNHSCILVSRKTTSLLLLACKANLIKICTPLFPVPFLYSADFNIYKKKTKKHKTWTTIILSEKLVLVRPAFKMREKYVPVSYFDRAWNLGRFCFIHYLKVHIVKFVMKLKYLFNIIFVKSLWCPWNGVIFSFYYQSYTCTYFSVIF